MISCDADQEPMLQVNIEGKPITLMLDTGASYSCLNPRYASHLPMSGKYIKTVGFSGVTQLLPMTAPVSITLKDTEIRIPVLVSEHTPVNLLGRDAICKLKMQVWCTPDGIYVDDRAIRQMNVSTLQQTQEPCANIYWLGELKEDVEKTISKWGRYIREQLCEPSLPKTEFHCTMKYDENKDPELENRWLENTKGLKIPMISQYIVVGLEGAALQVDREKFIDEWFEVPNSVPHITLYVSKNCASKDLGPMMQKAEKCKWEATENPLIFQSSDKAYLKILCATPMLGVPRMVINTKIDPKVNEHQTKQTELLKEMEKQVPLELWSQHDTDVGLVKSANPIKIVLRSGTKMPKKMQYPLKPEAVQGIKKTIEGLVEAGVLVESNSYCNTPILPVAKADKSKWRLVHDLRAVNEVVEDWPAEVPNPHTLLTNVPSAANYFTVIDLCSAFFSVPLAEESRPLFAFTYQGKKLTYTRIPQGFKHSPHVFNQVLKEDLSDLRLDSTLIQYVDDLLISSMTLEQCHQDSIKVLTKLAEGGHKASKEKLQYCLPQVEYLGRTISHGMKAISPSQLEGISKAPQPQTVGQMMTFLGMTGFSADWIEDYAIKTAPLRALMKQVGHQNLRASLTWTADALIAFESLKKELQSAPALTTPTYDKPFHLYVANRKDGYASAVLMQETCSGRKKTTNCLL